MKLLLRPFISVLMVAGALAAAPSAPATAAGETPASIDPVVLGIQADAAAGSCWEIKHLRPTAPDGSYWLYTPKMLQPQQFYCDMTTDGGGWVLVGKGRETWLTNYTGNGSASSLLTPTPTTSVSNTVQLASRTVDALLNGGRVDALTDGVRLRRAKDAAGATWQEVRMHFNGKKDRWNWVFGTENPLTSYSIDGVTSTGGSSASFGTDQAYKRVNNTTDAAHGYRQGFFYGSGVTGSTSATSYLWANTDGGRGAAPFTDVYVRPRVTTDDAGFTAIPDGGTAAVAQQKTLRNDALVTPWGVANRTGDTSNEYSVETQAFTQSGNTMYVGGNFSYVQKDAAGTGRVTQPYLAAFDITTGELVTSFKPALNEQVRALATLPDGTVVAGGDFTTANGAPATAIVALDPVTGATRSNFKVTIEDRITGETLRVRSLDLEGNWLYIGGAVTHFAGGTRPNTSSYMRGLGRVAVDGTPSTDWNPNFNGTVAKTDGSADGTRIYAAGFFTMENGAAAPNAAAVSTAPGAALATPTWAPKWSASKSYQQTILEAGNRVWVGGSEHSLFSYDTSTFERLSGNIAKPNGDTQSITSRDGLVFAGCHCAGFEYENAYSWRSMNSDWSRADALHWFGQWDATTGARVPDFTPNIRMRGGAGTWALTTDSLGNVWAGGDISTVKTTSGVKFSGGFARFTMVDSTPPPTPSNFRMTSQTATTASFAWNRVTDSANSVHYQILRDDRPIAFTSGNTGTLTVPKGGSNRFFVRAVDSADNASASSSVATSGAANQPPTAAFTSSVSGATASFDASASSDPEGPVSSYAWTFGDGSTGAGRIVSHDYASGTYTATLTVTDSAGTTNAVSHDVSVVASVTDHVVVAKGSTWKWRYDTTAPPTGWNTAGFDSGAWNAGNGVLGFGAPSVTTNIDTFATKASRPLAAYFTKQFQVDDATKVVKMTLDSVADDGAVFYVNGTEVARVNMPTGAVTIGTYASSARNSTTANNSPVVVDVPVTLLTNGTNVVSAETHLNYRGTRDVTFDLQASLTYDDDAVASVTDHVVVAKGSTWKWRYDTTAPPTGWNTAGFDSGAWSAGNGVLGFGAPSVTTDIDTFATKASRPLAAYFTKQFQVDDATKVVKMTLDSVADDGAVFYVNGTEVARVNMPTGAVTIGTYASSARNSTTANNSPVVVDVPVTLLTNGTNVVSAETHLNYRGTRDVTFDLQASLTY